jgi:hypothetical protein
MIWAIRSVSHIGSVSLRVIFVVAFLLLGQFITLSHSVDHDSGQNDCVVCRISKPYKQVSVLLITAGTAVPTGLIGPVFVQTPPILKLIVCDTQRKRAPPTPS